VTLVDRKPISENGIKDTSGTEIPKINKNICVGNVSDDGLGESEDVVNG
jgi:hypothetical protein